MEFLWVFEKMFLRTVKEKIYFGNILQTKSVNRIIAINQYYDGVNKIISFQ